MALLKATVVVVVDFVFVAVVDFVFVVVGGGGGCGGVVVANGAVFIGDIIFSGVN